MYIYIIYKYIIYIYIYILHVRVLVYMHNEEDKVNNMGTA